MAGRPLTEDLEALLRAINLHLAGPTEEKGPAHSTDSRKVQAPATTEKIPPCTHSQVETMDEETEQVRPAGEEDLLEISLREEDFMS